MFKTGDRVWVVLEKPSTLTQHCLAIGSVAEVIKFEDKYLDDSGALYQVSGMDCNGRKVVQYVPLTGIRGL